MWIGQRCGQAQYCHLRNVAAAVGTPVLHICYDCFELATSTQTKCVCAFRRRIFSNKRASSSLDSIHMQWCVWLCALRSECWQNLCYWRIIFHVPSKWKQKNCVHIMRCLQSPLIPVPEIRTKKTTSSQLWTHALHTKLYSHKMPEMPRDRIS